MNENQNDLPPQLDPWLKIIAKAPAPTAPADLLEKTMAAVQRDRMKIQPTPSPIPSPLSPRPFRYLREFAAMAVAASILAMVVSLGIFQARQSSYRVACAENLTHFAKAFATYAAQNNNALPNLGDSAEPGGGNWLTPDLTVANAHTNADNLLPLMNASLITPDNLLCPGRDLPASSKDVLRNDNARGYSYANLFSAHKPTWDNTHATILLADRNPLFGNPAVKNAAFNSYNHDRRGNYTLRADSSITWETSPNIGPAGDNIWTIAGTSPQPQTTYTGLELPLSPTDVFLAP